MRAYFKLGIAAAIEPLLEECIELMTGRLFKRDPQIVRLDGLKCVLMEIVFDAFEEGFIAENMAQHIDDESAFLIGMTVKQLDRVMVMIKDDRATAFAEILAQILVVVDEAIERGLVGAERVFAPEHFG